MHILQGHLDRSVPLEHARALAALLTGGWAELTEIDDGDHGLSRPQDLDRLFAIIAGLIERSTANTG